MSEVRLRGCHPFDDPVPFDLARSWNVLSGFWSVQTRLWFDRGFKPRMSATFYLYYVELGQKRGIRLAVGFVHGERKPYLGLGAYPLHSLIFREMDIEEELAIKATLRRVANMCDPEPLVEIERVPGFAQDDEYPARNQQGWYTRSLWARRLLPPRWAPESEVYDIREGIYFYFSGWKHSVDVKEDLRGFELCRVLHRGRLSE